MLPLQNSELSSQHSSLLQRRPLLHLPRLPPEELIRLMKGWQEGDMQ
jgi:hypothetical protein